jgi:hypothetical protein
MTSEDQHPETAHLIKLYGDYMDVAVFSQMGLEPTPVGVVTDAIRGLRSNVKDRVILDLLWSNYTLGAEVARLAESRVDQ